MSTSAEGARVVGPPEGLAVFSLPLCLGRHTVDVLPHRHQMPSGDMRLRMQWALNIDRSSEAKRLIDCVTRPEYRTPRRHHHPIRASKGRTSRHGS